MSAIGVHSTKAHTILVELSRTGMEYEAGRAAILPGFDYSPDTDARSSESSTFALALRQIPGALRRRSAYVALSGRDVIFRMSATGSGDPASIRAVVRLEVDTMSGSGDSMIAAHQRIESPDGAQMVLIGVSRETYVEHYAATLRHAGLSCAGFVPASIALYQCYLMAGSLDYDGVVLVANVGETTTDIVLVTGGNLLLARTVSYGVNDIIDRVSTDVGLEYDRARDTLFNRITIKPGVVDDNASGDRAVLAAQDGAARLFAQLSSAITFGRAQLQFPKLDAGKIVICGPGASIPGMREFLMGRFRKTVETMNPLKAVNLSKLDETSATMLKQYATALAIPLGLAKIAADRAEGSIVFEPSSLVVRRNFFQRTVWLYAGALLLVAALSCALLFSHRLSVSASEVKRQAVEGAAGYSAHHLALQSHPVPLGAPALDEVAAMSELNRDLLVEDQRLIELCEARRPGLDAVMLFNELVANMPEHAMLTAFSLTSLENGTAIPEPGVVVELFIASSADDMGALYGAVRDIIKKHPLVAGVDPGNPVDVGDGSGKTATVTVHLRTVAEAMAKGKTS